MDTLKRSLSALLVLVMVLSMLPMSALATEGVPEEIYRIEYDGHEYALMTGCGSWNAAKTYCQDVGGYLATITSEEENLVLHEFILSMGVENAYFGLSYAQESDSWSWVTGESVSYENWGAGEPGSVNAGENYGLFYYDFPDGGWSHGSYGEETVGKGYPLFFLCEWGDYAADAETEKTKNEQYIQDQIDLNTGSVIVEKDATVILQKDFSFPGSLMSLWIEGTIIVPSGKTLTINSSSLIMGSIVVEKGAALHINGSCTVAEGGLLCIADGGKLILNSAQIAVSGTLDMAGTYELTGWNPAITLRMNWEGTGTVLGIEPEALRLYYVVNSAETLKAALNLLEAGSYLKTDVTIPYDHNHPEGLTLYDDLTIPASGALQVYANFTISEGVTVTNHGTIEMSPAEKATFTNNGSLINHGTISQSTYDGAKVVNNAVIENNGTMIVYWGLLVNQDLIRNNGQFTISASYAGEGVLENNGQVENSKELYLDGGRIINNGAISNVGEGTLKNEDGTWEGNQPVRAKMTQDDLEAALANAAATGSYYALKNEVVLERDLTVNTFFDISSGGRLVVPENVTLTLNQSISVMPGGVLEVVGDYKLNDGIINVYNFGNDNIGTVHGVEMAHMCLNADANSESELLSALETAANTNYNFDCIYVISSFELTKNAVIPQHCVIHMYNGATLTVQKGATLTNEGDIYIWQGQTLVNNGTIENKAYIHDDGKVLNNGTVNDSGNISVNGTWEGNDPAYPHTHAYTETVTAPTCTEKGYTTYTCECGDSYTGNEIAALGHAEVTDKAIEATCTEAGKTEGKHCDRCGEIIVAQTEVPAKGHSFGDWYVTKEATVDAEGEERRDCAACDHFETRAIPKVEIPTEGQCGGGLTWSYDKTTGTLTITGSGAMWNFTISLKQKSADPMVPWAAYQSEIKAVVLSEGITSIGNNAFAGCENLTEVTLPKTVTAIGEGAFLASGLKEITFQGDAPEVSESAFQGVSATITYPQDNETWTEDKKQDFGGDLTWDKPEDDHGYQLGDVNHDGKINAKDATLILQKSVGVLKDSAKFCEDCAEVSGDGKLNAKDSTLILQFSVGLRQDFPAQK